MYIVFAAIAKSGTDWGPPIVAASVAVLVAVGAQIAAHAAARSRERDRELNDAFDRAIVAGYKIVSSLGLIASHAVIQQHPEHAAAAAQRSTELVMDYSHELQDFRAASLSYVRRFPTSTTAQAMLQALAHGKPMNSAKGLTLEQYEKELSRGKAAVLTALDSALEASRTELRYRRWYQRRRLAPQPRD